MCLFRGIWTEVGWELRSSKPRRRKGKAEQSWTSADQSFAQGRRQKDNAIWFLLVSTSELKKLIAFARDSMQSNSRSRPVVRGGWRKENWEPISRMLRGWRNGSDGIGIETGGRERGKNKRGKKIDKLGEERGINKKRKKKKRRRKNRQWRQAGKYCLIKWMIFSPSCCVE